jgi:lysophospholipase L1-like esterase
VVFTPGPELSLPFQPAFRYKPRRNFMKPQSVIPLLSALALALVGCATTRSEVQSAAPRLLPPKPADAYFAKFNPAPAPQPAGLVLKKGDRLAICGDSITEQKMYSRLIETYLTACVPDLEVTVRQYGWSGETAPGFLRRMTNDCLRFEPTIATTCYGMNDHRYRPYEPAIGETYSNAMDAIVESFKHAGARVILGSPGCVGLKGIDPKTGQRPKDWDEAGVEAKNLNLCTLRNIDIEIANKEHVGFADVFWPMLITGFDARQKYNPNYAMAGGDGVHPNWAGHTVMAYAFLRGMGLDGELGVFNLDLKSGKATASRGHEVISSKDGIVEIKSSRYPFCATGDVKSDGSIRSAMTLIPFNRELNRFLLRVNNTSAKSYKVTWGNESRTYTAEQLQRGVNLADDFAENPFSDAFKKVDAAVAAKQAYETRQIKKIFHDLVSGRVKPGDIEKDPELKRLAELRGPDGKLDRDKVAAETEKTRAPLAAAIKEAMVPVTHTIKVEPQ